MNNETLAKLSNESFLFDTHAHLFMDAFTTPSIDNSNEAVHALLQRAYENNVRIICDISTSEEELKASLAHKQCEKEPVLIRAAAITPHDVHEGTESFFSQIRQAAQNKQLSAIGETGLDYYRPPFSEQLQKEMLRRQMLLAYEYRLPLIIHCRNAFSDFFDLYDDMCRECHYSFPGIVHCFTGTVAEAKKALDRDLFVSISGIVTFPSAHNVREVVPFLPKERILIETDAPYLSPEPHRGKKNEPAFVRYVCQVCAKLRAISEKEMAQQTFINGKMLFGI